MSVARAQRLLLDRLSAGQTMLLAAHLALTPTPEWCDGVDADGHAVLLVGAHALRALPTGEEAVTQVLETAAEGHHLPGVRAVGFQPKASEALHVMWMATNVDEELIDGERNSGKTQLTAGGLAGMAELHGRAGFAWPFIVLWLHSSLTNAKHKTVPSLEQTHWGGLWTFQDDHQTAVLTVGGIVMVLAHFVGVTDPTSSERLRAEAHMVVAEEVIPSLDEGGGISERHFDLSKNSARLPTRRRIAVAVTNPGDVDTWPFRRFIEGGGRPGRARVQVPASDRLTAAEVQKQIDDFTDSPDLQARLGRGEWSALKLGECVAEGYDPVAHVAREPLTVSENHQLAIGWDGGHTPSAVICQLIGGTVRVYAALNDMKAGVLQLIEDQVAPWLIQHAPWARHGGGGLTHVIDPSLATASQSDIRESGETVIRETLRGRIVKGAVAWAPRREAVLRVLAPRTEGGVVPLAISPVPETTLMRSAFASRWYYPRTPDGRVDRSRPKKPNSPFADVGDAAAYVFGWLRPGTDQAYDAKPKPREPLKYKRLYGAFDGEFV